MNCTDVSRPPQRTAPNSIWLACSEHHAYIIQTDQNLLMSGRESRAFGEDHSQIQFRTQ